MGYGGCAVAGGLSALANSHNGNVPTQLPDVDGCSHPERLTMPDAAADVTVNIEHPECPVVPDATDDIISDLIWAQNIERLILTGWHDPSLAPEAASLVSSDDEMLCSDGHPRTLPVTWQEKGASEWSFGLESAAEFVKPRAVEFGDRIFVVRFTRSGGSLERAMHHGGQLEPVRTAAAQRGQHCRITHCGASIFVYPNQYDGVQFALKQIDLRSHHVVINEAFLPLLFCEVGSIPCRAKVRPAIPTLLALIDDDGSLVCTIEHTFFFCQSYRPTYEVRAKSASQARLRSGVQM